jgi:hypothetical protein
MVVVTKYVKILMDVLASEEEDVIYKEGVNVAPDDRKISFTRFENFPEFLLIGDIIADVLVLENEQITVDPLNPNNLKATCVIISNIRKVDVLPEWTDLAFCLSAVSQNINALEYINPLMIDEYQSICLAAVRTDGYALELIERKYQTAEIQRAAIEQNGSAIQFVEEHQPNDVYLEVVRQNGYNLRWVPKQLINYELCLEAIRNYGLALKHVPDELKSEELCQIAVQKDRFALKYVPTNLKTVELCLSAVGNYKHMMRYVPVHLKEIVKSRLIQVVN